MAMCTEKRRVRLLVGAALAVAVVSVTACDRRETSEEATSDPPRQADEQKGEDGERARKMRPGQADEKAESEDESSDVPQSLDELPEGVNAVQHEMQLLNTAMQNTLTLIANDQLEAVPAQIKNVHPARKLTEKAIETGRYEPPVNADAMDRLAELDEAFHEDLRGLVRAAKDDDLGEATAKYKDLVQGCTDCHTEFRFE